MRSPLWETSPGALVALLNSGAPLDRADLYTLRLAGGAVYRWSGSDIAIQSPTHLYTVGPGVKRSRVRWTVGVSVDSMTVTFYPDGTQINGQPLMAAIHAGLLEGATFQVDKAFWTVGDTAPRGALLWFIGGDPEVQHVDRFSATLSWRSSLALLNTMVPRDVYQAGCLNTLYDPRCGLNRAALAVTGAATGASTVGRTVFPHALGQAAGYFDLGVVTFTTGPNAGVSRTVKQHTSGVLVALQPWPFPVASGHAFSVVPGCDKTVSTCTSKFNNRARFRGTPFVPVPETVM